MSKLWNDITILEFNVNSSNNDTLTTAPAPAMTAPGDTVKTAPDTVITVSLGKGFVSKGKQHQKQTALETQSHTQ